MPTPTRRRKDATESTQLLKQRNNGTATGAAVGRDGQGGAHWCHNHGAGINIYTWAIVRGKFRENVGKYSSTMEHLGVVINYPNKPT